LPRVAWVLHALPVISKQNPNLVFPAFRNADLLFAIRALAVITVRRIFAGLRAVVAIEPPSPIANALTPISVRERITQESLSFPAAFGEEAAAGRAGRRLRLCQGHPRYQGQQATPEYAPDHTQRLAARNRPLGQTLSYLLEAVFRRELFADGLSFAHLFSFPKLPRVDSS
jgi:hypothetical protein